MKSSELATMFARVLVSNLKMKARISKQWGSGGARNLNMLCRLMILTADDERFNYCLMKKFFFSVERLKSIKFFKSQRGKKIFLDFLLDI